MMQVEAMAAASPELIVPFFSSVLLLSGKNLTQHRSMTSVRNRRVPMTVEKAQASSMWRCMRSCGDSLTEFRLWTLLTASRLGRMQVLIMRANRWTATRTVVQALKAMSSPGGYLWSRSSWTSTMATIANPDNRAEVRLVAFNLARLKYSFLHDRACKECSFKLIPKVVEKSPVVVVKSKSGFQMD